MSDRNISTERLDNLLIEKPSIWVFGYGSLLWKPDFPYELKLIGHIRDFERRFNQGNETYRGAPGKPGRVANLEEKPGAKTWGVAYKISGHQEISETLQKLYVREAKCGGYITMVTTFYPRDYATIENCDSDPIRVYATKENCDADPIRKYATMENCDIDPIREYDPMENCDTGPTNDTTSHSSRLSTEIATGDDSTPEINETTHNVPGRLSNSFQSVHEEVESNGISVAMRVTEAAIPDDVTDVAVPRSESENATTSTSTSPASTGLTRDESFASTTHREIKVLLYTVTCTSDNSLYLGTDGDNLSEMARQIVDRKGTAGTNAEYVLKIADFVREYIPDDKDEYLFALEREIGKELYRRINLQRTESNVHEHEASLISVRVRAA